MRAALFDTSVYVSALRLGDDAVVASRRIASGALLWLSAVVLEELYAGADDRTRPAVEALEKDFHRAGRILVPNLHDWTLIGRVLSSFARKHGYEQIGRQRLTNDALIALSAARTGIRVLTANQRDFQRLAEVRNFDWELVTF